MRAALFAALLIVCAGMRGLWAEEGASPLGSLHKGGAVVTITLERGQGSAATLIGTFVPDPPVGDRPPGHFYSLDLKSTLGRPTLIELKPGGPVQATGALSADKPVHVLKSLDEDLPVYPEGPVTLRLPIRLPAGPVGQAVDVIVQVTYMVCGTGPDPKDSSRDYCLQPVAKQVVTVSLPTVPADAGTLSGQPAAASIDPAVLREIVRTELDATRATDGEAMRTLIAEELAKAAAGKSIRWRHPRTVAEVEQLIAEAHQAGKAALLDFTGPSCSNCQNMEKTVFRDPGVIAAWNSALPISVNTDPPFDELAAWQQQRFKDQGRPLYVRLDPPSHPAGGGVAPVAAGSSAPSAPASEERWNKVFDRGDGATMQRFLAFLGGGRGVTVGSGSGMGQFILIALLGGLFTLVMPCTYPMIPFTLNFFAKQAASGRRLVPLAAFYAGGIIACFVGLGVLITGIFGSTLATVSGHPVTNLVIALLFTLLGLSLLGAFFLRLPSALEGSLGGSRGGYLGALIMGLTFAITAFTCTAPFAGSVLADAVSTGSWTRAMLGMAIYASAIAVPFFLLAISPGALARIPRAGAWMNEFKVVGGMVELAAALKFLAICDLAWGWGVVGRTLTIAVWAAVALFLALYTLGRVRMPGDAPVAEAGLGRVLIGVAFGAVGLWLLAGLAGHNLGVLESFFPGDAAP